MEQGLEEKGTTDKPTSITEGKAASLCSTLPRLLNDFLAEVKRKYQENGTFSDEVLLALHSFFGTPLEKALELLEKECLTYIHAENGTRYVIQVIGSSGIPYTLFPEVNYCPCRAYRYQVVGTGAYLTCKHVMAGYLADIVGNGRHLHVTNEELSRLLCSVTKLE